MTSFVRQTPLLTAISSKLCGGDKISTVSHNSTFSFLRRCSPNPNPNRHLRVRVKIIVMVVYKMPYRRAPRLACRLHRPSASREQRYLAYNSYVVYKIPCARLACIQDLYTRYPIVARALGLAAECVARAKVYCIQIQDTLSSRARLAFRPSAREQRNLAYKRLA